MSTYIKKYDVGNIAMDLPYNSYIHELPLLSFKDFRNSVNISLIFNRKLKIEEDNSFNVGEGYKLNIHKKIIFQNNIPVKLMESNGKYVLLNRNKNSEDSSVYNNVYTFDDDSQRVLRVKSKINEETNQLETYYEVEHSDLSIEEYNSLGYLHFVYDKYDDVYLEYNYENNLLTWVKYSNNDNYKITFSYYNNELTSIAYGGTTTTLVYDDPDLTVIHYSGVTYYITVTDTKFTVKGSGTEDTGLYYRIKECSYSGNYITLTYKEGTTEIDRLLYTFPSSVTGNCQAYNYVYITNKNNVEKRIQFNGDKPLYSYEVDYDYDEVQFNGDKCTSDVTIHNTLNTPQANLFKGTIKYDSGMSIPEMTEYPNKWCVQVRSNDEITDTYLVTGWVKSSSTTGDHEIKVGYGTGSSELIHNFNVKINKINQWHFFAYQFDIKAKYVVVSNSSNLDIKDLRIMYRATDISEVKNNAFVSLKEDILIDNTSNASLLFKEVTFEYETEAGDYGELNLTFSDVLRYMKKKNRDGSFNELYHENCKKVITDILWFRVYINETGTYKDIDKYGVGYLQYINGKQYDTRIQKYGNTTMFNISNNKDKSYYSYQYLNEYFDVKEDHHDGIDTYYTRDKGLITNENQTGNYNITYTYNTTNNTLVVNDSYNNYFMSSDVTYYMDPVWGTMYKKQMSNATKIEDTYDDDMSVILEKEFNKQTLGIKHLFGYNKGNLTSLSCDTLNYTFGYTKDKISQVTKFSSAIEERVHTDTTSTIYYPSQTNAVYNEQYVYDKYNRVKGITNVLENTYNVFSEFNESTGAPNEDFDTNNSKLVMSEDKLKSQKSRFHYNHEGTLSKVEVSKSTDYSNKISNETFAYDDANRLLSKEFVYDPSLNGKVNDVFTYVKTADNPNLDEVIKTSKYSINGTDIVNTTNSYLNKRLDVKTHNFDGKIVTKDYDYSVNKVTSESNSIFDVSTTATTYAYDTFDRLSSITSNGKEITYEYDIYNRLIRENNQPLDKTIIYSYNDIGNIVTNTTYAYTLDTTPAILRSSKTYSYDTTIKDRLISFNGTTIPYNMLGCPTTYNGYNLTWNKGKLTGMSKGSLELGTESYNYSYNALGQRVSKTYYKIEGTSPIIPVYDGETLSIEKKYYYDYSGRLIREANTYSFKGGTTANELIEYIYDVNTIIGIRYTKGATTNVYYFDRNIFGDVVGIYDTSGVLKVKYLYDAYGNCTVSGETTDTNLAKINPIRYRGYYYDVETNLALVSSRYYSPELGRFIQPADVSSLNPQSINGLNLYNYANNNPIGLVYSSSSVGFGDSGAMVSSLSLGGISSLGNNLGYSNSFNILGGLNWPQFNAKDLVKDTFISLGEVGSRIAWGLTKNGRAFLDFHYSAYGINGYTALDNLSSASAKIFKGIGIGLMALDVIEAGYYSYQNGHSFGQGALNVGLTAGKNLLVYKASTGVATAVGTWAGAKLGASLGSAAGPVGFVIGAVAGAAVGWVIDEFGDVIIDWVVGWFD